ncbi:PREDICTED: caprin-1 isoform X1 [Lepidothrix coronata]|uniref:Caprin-1 isoform X1 n=1 Tax=Lepidothrix coronata TaxID=321398 RepID=A0A6J0I824_9PASS|nr:PREDICTED: caprin-1 isoform X1 [Lepidothrix coronata]XP_017682241.1 PREDICTED: caprin-1 isoform X1 [Lepidothrix coronata]
MPSATNSTMASSTTGGSGGGAGKAAPGSEAAPAVAAAAPQAAAAGVNITTVQTEAMKQILGVIDKKLRNLEKKKSKLDDYQERMNKGERLNQDQLDAVSKYQEVTNNLEFAKELQRSFMALSQDIQKTIKKTARREQLMREEAEQKRLKTVLELQFILEKLGDDEVRSDLKQGSSGVPVLTEEELTMLDEFYKLVYPERDMNVRLNEQYEQASVHLWDLLEGKEKPVCGTTYKALKEVVERILQTSYFDSTHNHQNGLCEEEEAAPASAVEDTVAEAEPDAAEEFTEPTEVESTEYVNRQFMAEAQFSSSEKEQVDEWTVETVEVVNSLQQQTQATSPPVPEPHTLPTVAQADPLVRRQRVQDLMAQMQGPYNFMQDSMLEFENQTLDPAIVSAQPMNPAQSLDMPQMVCPPVHAESRLAQPTQVPVQPEATQASMSLNADQTPSSSSLPTASQPQVFQAGSSKPLHSSGINVNAAPFQSMQTVFNMNAPVPPVNEPETLKQQNQYQASYNQSFSSQPHQVEQSDLQQEQLQTVVGTYHGSPDQTHQVAGNHQQPPQQNTGFPRNSQPYYNSRGVSRGGSRGARGLMNGYRGPANGFRGGYDGYRPSFSNTPNSGYTQPQFNAPRDYSNYQRDGYQQNFKRGSGQSGPRGAPRGRGGPPRPNRGMPQMNAQQVN